MKKNSSPKKTEITHLWSRLTSTRWEDTWKERLQFVGPEFLVIKVFPNSRALRLEVYTNKTIAQKLCKNFGGSVRPFQAATWTPPALKNKDPRPIGKSLLLYNHEKSFLEDRQKFSKKKRLCIPAGMAFGTGDHATTNGCLRLLESIQKELPQKKWSLLDLGTGSGILAFAGALLGAKKILGIDNDPQAIATAQKNSALNGLPQVCFQQADLLQWKPNGKWEVITANIYSSVLTVLAPTLITHLSKEGFLILSGILKKEHLAIREVFSAQGMKETLCFSRGKWCALLLERKSKF